MQRVILSVRFRSCCMQLQAAKEDPASDKNKKKRKANDAAEQPATSPAATVRASKKQKIAEPEAEAAEAVAAKKATHLGRSEPQFDLHVGLHCHMSGFQSMVVGHVSHFSKSTYALRYLGLNLVFINPHPGRFCMGKNRMTRA